MIQVEVEKLVYGGEGLARSEGRVLFIPFSAPGDRLLVEVLEERTDFARAKIKQIIEPSPDRRIPPCPYYGTCGGCQLQHLTYPAQLRAKVEFVKESLTRIGGIDWSGNIEIISPESLMPPVVAHREGKNQEDFAIRNLQSAFSRGEFNYRLRAQLKVQAAGGQVKIGYYQPASHELCEIDHCPLLSQALNDSLNRLRNLPDYLFEGAQTIDLAQGEDGRIVTHPPVDLSNDSGILQTLSCITSDENKSLRTPQSEIGNLAGVCWRVGQLIYWFDAQTFFQANRFLLADLHRLVVEGEEGDRALDLFCGVGFFAIPLGHRFKAVIGVESDSRAIRFATRNAAENQAPNCWFEAASVERWLMRNRPELGAVDLGVIDPPRAGLSKQTVRAIARLRPERITYVSCNPTTLARDLKWFLQEGYTISTITALDLFPQTFHVETVVKLRR